MPRGIGSTMQSIVTGSHVPLALLVELEFPSGTVRFATTAHDVVSGGNTYLGAGHVSGIEPVEESVTPSAQVLNLRFSGIDPAHIGAVLSDHYQGQPARLYLAAFDAELRVAATHLVGEYRMDEPVITIGDTATVQLGLENRFADWDRPRLRRYSHADQTAAYAGDLGFEYAEALQNASIVWGIYRGPVAPDPVKVFNRTLDKIAGYKIGGIPLFPGASQQLNALRKVADFATPAVNKVKKFFGF